MQPLQDIQCEMRGLADRIKLSLKFSPGTAKGDEKEWQVDQSITVPEELEFLLNDYSLVANPRDNDRGMIRPRMDAILFGQLGKVKKAHQSDGGYEPLCAPSNPLWICQQNFTLDVVSDDIVGMQDMECPIEVVVTYALKHGERAGIDLNLVVLRKDTPGLEGESEEVLAAMTAIHRARKAAWAVTDLYGLHTDSYDWRFFHVNDCGQVVIVLEHRSTEDNRSTLEDHGPGGDISKKLGPLMILCEISTAQEESASDSKV